MSKTPWTPGRVIRGMEYPKPVWLIQDAEGGIVCEMRKGADNAETEARARLIAAAPEMAELLRIIVEACFADHDFPQIVPMAKVEEARALLARIGAP